MTLQQSIQEAQSALGELARQSPAPVLLALIEQLIDLACTGGNPVRTAVHETIKLQFYRRVLARLGDARGRDGSLTTRSGGGPTP